MSATRALLARALLSVILVADDTGRGGVCVASSWTLWDGMWCSEAIAVNGGERGWLCTVWHLMLWSMGDKGAPVLAPEKRGGSQGTREMVRGGWCCSAQCLTVALLSDAGQVFDQMAARDSNLNFSKIFGGSTS